MAARLWTQPVEVFDEQQDLLANETYIKSGIPSKLQKKKSKYGISDLFSNKNA